MNQHGQKRHTNKLKTPPPAPLSSSGTANNSGGCNNYSSLDFVYRRGIRGDKKITRMNHRPKLETRPTVRRKTVFSAACCRLPKVQNCASPHANLPRRLLYEASTSRADGRGRGRRLYPRSTQPQVGYGMTTPVPDAHPAHVRPPASGAPAFRPSETSHCLLKNARRVFQRRRTNHPTHQPLRLHQSPVHVRCVSRHRISGRSGLHS